MNERKKLHELPITMAERALMARKLAAENPAAVDIDDEILPWIYDPNQEIWVSFDGNYSRISPAEKRQKAEDYRIIKEQRDREREKKVEEQLQIQMLWSRVREIVLKRDNFTCQICRKFSESSLHIHHILKRKHGGTDHLDNLITVCNRCHPAADNYLYDPDWSVRPSNNYFEQ
jgi:5-methylcytosine-specific restriction endonuclease McrA